MFTNMMNTAESSMLWRSLRHINKVITMVSKVSIMVSDILMAWQKSVVRQCKTANPLMIQAMLVILCSEDISLYKYNYISFIQNFEPFIQYFATVGGKDDFFQNQ
jgi:hypothetical protein